MSFEAERALIEGHFQTGWAASAFSSIPVIYENVPINQPTTDFIIHRISDSDGRQMEITGGSAYHRYVGLVSVDILVRTGTGTRVARQLADVVSSIYRRAQITSPAAGRITFRTPDLKAMGTFSERYRLIVICPYQRDILQ